MRDIFYWMVVIFIVCLFVEPERTGRIAGNAIHTFIEAVQGHSTPAKEAIP